MAKKRPEAKPQPQPQQRRDMIVVKAAENAAPVYTNNVVIELSPWDIRFRFGELLEASPTQLKVLERLTVVMSPQHAAVMAQLLNQHIEAYQNTYGPIPAPRGRVAEPSFSPSTEPAPPSEPQPSVERKIRL
jgi:hypothetical protein